MVLWPFHKKRIQRLTSVITIIIGIMLMITTPAGFKLYAGITISGFVIGLIIAFVGFLYFMDVQ